MAPLTIDWLACWKAFKAVHGEPILWNGRLLFHDGWMHAKDDPKGPEYRPPTHPEALRLLQLRYWREMMHKCQVEYRQIHGILKEAEELQHTKSAPITLTQAVWDESVGRRVRREVNIEDLRRGRMADLLYKLQECITKVRQLERPGDQPYVPSQQAS